MSWQDILTFSFGFAVGIVVSGFQVRKVQHEAATDTLTGLYNRALLSKTLGRLLAAAKRDKKSLTILMIDMNHFKEANDRFGHQFGDLVLKTAAEAMVKNLRAADFIFRYGGDEFLIILPSTTEKGAETVAKKIKGDLDKISLQTPRGTAFEDVGASIGIASYPTHAEVDHILIKAADDAVYLAKDKKGHIEVAKKNES